ncbi:regulatory protein GemA [Neorhizobium sp. T786]|uniref:gp16 family protein n=1 Tax=Pseudorhizobium xiangyangii TaxID=2883104 RepID=UPI001CFF874E|nr:regulatory protein GemA [Neorhizobium xiangyangii]MCB5204232.1 regulatory protein GemA [Neorhizobium xiangyangii]
MTSSFAAIHVAKKQLGLDEDTYRGKLQLITGKSSTKDMSEAERQKVLTVFRNEGFTPASATRREGGRQKLSGKFAKKLQALWIAAYNLGIVRDRDDAALETFIKRQTGIERERWLRHADDASKVIDALKGWIAREAGVDWSLLGLHPQSHLRATGYKIAAAQWAILSENRNGFWPAIVEIVGGSVLDRHLDDQQWIRVMNAFGERIRSRKVVTS